MAQGIEKADRLIQATQGPAALNAARSSLWATEYRRISTGSAQHRAYGFAPI